jgi:hypothetical protein
MCGIWDLCGGNMCSKGGSKKRPPNTGRLLGTSSISFCFLKERRTKVASDVGGHNFEKLMFVFDFLVSRLELLGSGLMRFRQRLMLRGSVCYVSISMRRMYLFFMEAARGIWQLRIALYRLEQCLYHKRPPVNICAWG